MARLAPTQPPCWGIECCGRSCTNRQTKHVACAVGIFPYVLKLLQTTAPDLRATLVFIWAKVMAWDANAQVRAALGGGGAAGKCWVPWRGLQTKVDARREEGRGMLGAPQAGRRRRDDALSWTAKRGVLDFLVLL